MEEKPTEEAHPEEPAPEDYLGNCNAMIERYDPFVTATPDESISNEARIIYPHYSFQLLGGNALRSTIHWVRTSGKGKAFFKKSLQSFPFASYVCTVSRLFHDQIVMDPGTTLRASMPAYELFEIISAAVISAERNFAELMMALKSGSLGSDPVLREVNLFQSLYGAANSRLQNGVALVITDFLEEQAALGGCIKNCIEPIVAKAQKGKREKKGGKKERISEENKKRANALVRAADVLVTSSFHRWLLEYEWFINKVLQLVSLVKYWIWSFFTLKKANHMKESGDEKGYEAFIETKDFNSANGFSANLRKLGDLDYYASKVYSDYFMKTAFIAGDSMFTNLFAVRSIGETTEEERRAVEKYMKHIQILLATPDTNEDVKPPVDPEEEILAPPVDIERSERPACLDDVEEGSEEDDPPEESIDLSQYADPAEYDARMAKMKEMGLDAGADEDEVEEGEGLPIGPQPRCAGAICTDEEKKEDDDTVIVNETDYPSVEIANV